MYFKFFWFLRALLYSPFFGRFVMPSYIGKPVFLKGVKNILISKHVRIYPNVRMETHNEAGRIVIQEDVSIAQNVHITSGSDLVIGRSTTILANVFITNIDHNYKDIGIHIMKQSQIISETKIGENCYIGMGACIQAGTILGKQCIVGANSVVKGIFPDYCVIAGVPARIIKIYNPKTLEWEKNNK